MNIDLINRHIQAVAIQFISYRGQLPALAGFIVHSLGDQAPSADVLIHYLRKEETQKALLDYEVGLWKNSIGDWSLVSLATPQTIEAMKYRLEQFPTSNTQCRWCLQDAKRSGHIDHIPELDINGEPIHRSRLHRICMKPWLAMRVQVARARSK
ncbi:MAG: hypothetical protein ACI9UK_000672 [Candidatus Krumholzibacteriia bacterium]|jgi:hypothetical protein